MAKFHYGMQRDNDYNIKNGTNDSMVNYKQKKRLNKRYEVYSKNCRKFIWNVDKRFTFIAGRQSM